ncbi:hypothetical protein Tco_0804253 [Tanacetum coccineum]|uniref:Uncharacterized protein n=1 Tax=Tanacetum coccineum TaxID=301880 RepID=A0ABQ5A832_9ASTR
MGRRHIRVSRSENREAEVHTTLAEKGALRAEAWNFSSGEKADSQMHNNIMAAGSKERPPMLGPGRYSQWHSRFLRYLDTKTNGEYLRKCIFDGPYLPTNVLIAAVEAAENILPVAAHEEAETIHNMTAENRLYFLAEKEAIFLILTGIGDETYSLLMHGNTAKEMWTSIERLHKGKHNYYEAPVPQRSNAPSYKQSSSTRTSASTRHKGKEIAKPVTPQSESVSEETVIQNMPRRLEQAEWLEDTMKRLMSRIGSTLRYIAKIQIHNSDKPNPITTHCFEKDIAMSIPDSSNIFTNDNQLIKNAAECVDERAALANLNANYTS